MNTQLDRKRIIIFLLFAFGIAWITALVVYLTGGLFNSPEMIPGTGLSLALVLIAGVYMFAPALANLFTRLITREGWRDTYLKPAFRNGWKYWLAAWWFPPIFSIIGAVVFFLIWPEYYDSTLSTLSGLIPATSAVNIPLMALFAIQVVQGILLSPIVNGLFTFGEEFGWRGYLLQKLLPLGQFKAVLALGVIWGIWHAPVIAMGHNYGLDYPGAPWLGILAMIWFCIFTGTLLSWATLRAGSVWPAVIGHASLNGTAGIAIFLTRGNPNILVGPMPTGVVGLIAFTVFGVWILYGMWKNRSEAVVSQPPAELG